MIVTVCLNPAIDITYAVPAFVLGTSTTVENVQKRAGGKGINTARALAQLGEEVVVCGFAGGNMGEWLRSLLADDGLPARLTPIAGQTRQSVTVYDGGAATVFNERGPAVSDDEWLELLADIEGELPRASAISLSGSVPLGCPPDAYAQIIALARTHAVPSVVDASGPQLARAISAGPSITAPNLGELLDALDLPAASLDLLSAAQQLARRSGSAVVVSAGRDGLVAISDGNQWSATPQRILAGNPTGAGDAVTAALSRGLALRQSWPEMLNEATALAGAAVVSAVAGSIDLATYRSLLANNTVKEL